MNTHRSGNRRSTSLALSTAVLVTGAVALGGCSSSSASTSPSTSGKATSDQTLVVDAAASLTATFTEIAHNFESSHPGVDVKLSFAGSDDLAAQINAGAPVDVFASADETTMKTVTKASMAVGTPQDFATNVLTIITPPSNPAGITTFQDLGTTKKPVVVCAPQVPCGHATQEVEHATGVTIHPASEATDVTDVLSDVTSGQADAGLVYVTDARTALATKPGSLMQIDFPESKDAVNTYPIAEIKTTKHDVLAKAFIAEVQSKQGQTVLTKAGFGAP